MFMKIERAAVLMLVLGAGCATTAAGSGTARPVEAKSSDAPLAFFRRAPWSVGKDAANNDVLVHADAGMRFPASVGAIDRASVRIYDERTNDVGINYQGQTLSSEPRCTYNLTVYVYPATEPLAQHLEAIRSELVRANPDARPADRTLPLDANHGGQGLHAGYLNVVKGYEAFEGVSIFQRGRWFVKYRTTYLPASTLGCEDQIRRAASEMQLSVPK